ncbi:hypothetical protein EAI_12366 [Harpegnathos saltator]|uniref:Uncharacterized protein n=1 Tax=Harpegnathos saltator TaxID=610380 RepID=E2BYD2_HARSA|nr:hypothetical protein EAI_12366 [Harpegnathos saltator]
MKALVGDLRRVYKSALREAQAFLPAQDLRDSRRLLGFLDLDLRSTPSGLPKAGSSSNPAPLTGRETRNTRVSPDPPIGDLRAPDNAIRTAQTRDSRAHDRLPCLVRAHPHSKFASPPLHREEGKRRRRRLETSNRRGT